MPSSIRVYLTFLGLLLLFNENHGQGAPLPQEGEEIQVAGAQTMNLREGPKTAANPDPKIVGIVEKGNKGRVVSVRRNVLDPSTGETKTWIEVEVTNSAGEVRRGFMNIKYAETLTGTVQKALPVKVDPSGEIQVCTTPTVKTQEPLDWSEYNQALFGHPRFKSRLDDVKGFNCESTLGYWKNRLQKSRDRFLTGTQVPHSDRNLNIDEENWNPNLTLEDRATLVRDGFAPDSIQEIANQIQQISGGDPEATGLMLAVMGRETDFDPFLAEHIQKPEQPLSDPNASPMDKYYRPGAGPVQITAWTPEYAKEIGLGPHDYDLYQQLFRENNQSIPATLATKIPDHLKLETQKSKIKTRDDFIHSPYNLPASLWFGYHHAYLKGQHDLSQAMGSTPDQKTPIWSTVSQSDRQSVMGAVYNGGIHRVNCAIRRLKILNPQLTRLKWEDLRPLLYLDPVLKASWPPRVQEKAGALKEACGNLSQTECSCLDNEKYTPGPDDDLIRKCHPLTGRCSKASIMISYADAMPKYVKCLNGTLSKRAVKK